MRRLFLLAALLVTGAFLLSQALPRAGAGPAGGEDSYLPVVMNVLPPTPTPTPPPAGNGIFQRDLISYFPDYDGTKAFGFVRFFDGSPAWGGPDNFHVWVCFDGQGCYRSTDLDGTGYYDVNINGFPTPPIRTTGHSYLARGLLGQEVRVSQDFPIDTTAGSCWRMDWIECGEGDPNPVCQGTGAGYAAIPAQPLEGSFAPDSCPP